MAFPWPPSKKKKKKTFPWLIYTPCLTEINAKKCPLVFVCVIDRGVCGAVCFGFKGKSHSNRKIKKHAVWFGSIDFKNNIQTKPN